MARGTGTDERGLGKKVLDWFKKDTLPKILYLPVLGLLYHSVNDFSESLKQGRLVKTPVVNYVDKDSNGLSFSENYKIKELMNIEDSSKNYEPTLEDWKRAYNKIKSLDVLSEQ